MDKHVIVLGKNPLTSLSAIRPLGKAGYTVDLLYITNYPERSETAAASRYVRRTDVVPKEKEKVLEKLLQIGRENSRKTPLFPTDDFTASLLGEYREQLEPWFVFPYVIGGNVSESMDKAFQLKMAAAAGMKTAKSWIIDLKDAPVVVPGDMVYPCFVKPLASVDGSKQEMAICRESTELEKHLQMLRNAMSQRSVMVQEYLTVDHEYTMGGVCRDQEIYLPAVIRKTRIARKARGVTLSGTLVDCSCLAETMEAIFRFLKSMRFVGMFDLELMVTDKGIYFGELNMRPGGPNYIYFLCGVNLPQLAVQALQGTPWEEPLPLPVLGKRFYNNRVLWEDYINLYLPTEDLIRCLRESDYSLLTDPEDPAPGKIFRHQRTYPSIRGKIKRELMGKRNR